MMIYRFLIAIVAMAIPLRASMSYNTSALMQAGNVGLSFTPVSFSQGFSGSLLDLGSGLTFAGGGTLSTITTTINPGGSWPAGNILKGFSNGGEIDITLPTGTLAFGASFGELGGSIATITLSGNGGGSFSYQVSPASGVPVYIGVSSTSAFTSIKIAADFGFEDLALDNFSFGTGAETPEVATMVLMGSGLVMLAAIRRRVQKRRPRPDVVRFE
jgi:hypothetical protein